MKEVIPSPELGFIKRKTRRTKAAVIQTATSTHHKRLQKKRNEGEEMRWKGWEKKDKRGGMRGEGEGKDERGEMRGEGWEGRDKRGGMRGEGWEERWEER